jgi:hypothetical protein
MSAFVRFVRALRTALFGAPHRHTWETFEKYNVYGKNPDRPRWVDYVLRCKKCGDIKRVRT